MKSCFLFGHADCPDIILPKIEETIEYHYLNYGICSLYVGNRGNFDRLVSTAAKRVKRRYPDLQLILLLAYHPAERSVLLPKGFDNSFYPPLEKVPRPYAIVRANQYMVHNADSLICYVRHKGNSQALLEQALHRQQKEPLPIDNLAQ